MKFGGANLSNINSYDLMVEYLYFSIREKCMIWVQIILATKKNLFPKKKF